MNFTIVKIVQIGQNQGVETLRLPSREEIHAAYGEGEEAVVALIAVDDLAKNFIIVIPGANGQVGKQDLHRLESVLTQSQVLLLQLEIPLESVITAAKLAKEKDVTVILDPAPAQALPEEIYPLLDIITPNESEAELLVGFPIKTEEDAAKAAKTFKDRGVQNPIVKMGRRGALALMDDQAKFYKSFPVEAVDTVAGGALSVTKEGAQPAMPLRKDLLQLLDSKK